MTSTMMTERAFSESEYRGRVARLRTLMSKAGLDCVVCVGPEAICYFSGYDAHTHFSEQALVIGRDGDPALVIRDVDVAPAEDSSWVQDSGCITSVNLVVRRRCHECLSGGPLELLVI